MRLPADNHPVHAAVFREFIGDVRRLPRREFAVSFYEGNFFVLLSAQNTQSVCKLVLKVLYGIVDIFLFGNGVVGGQKVDGVRPAAFADQSGGENLHLGNAALLVLLLHQIWQGAAAEQGAVGVFPLLCGLYGGKVNVFHLYAAARNAAQILA